MRRRNAFQTLDPNTLPEVSHRRSVAVGGASCTPFVRRQTYSRRPRRSSIDSIGKEETFSSKKTPKTSNCAVTTTTEVPESYGSRPPIPPPQGQKKKKKGKSYITTRRRKTSTTETSSASPGFAIQQLNDANIDIGVIAAKSCIKKQQIHGKGNNVEKPKSTFTDGVLSKTHSMDPVREIQSQITPQTATSSSSTSQTAYQNIKDISDHEDVVHKKTSNIAEMDMEVLASSDDDDMDCGSDSSSLEGLDSSSEERDAAVQKTNPPNTAQGSGILDVQLDKSINIKNRQFHSNNRSLLSRTMENPEEDIVDSKFTDTSKDKFDARKEEPADDEDVFRLLMNSETGPSRKKGDKSELVGKVIGGDQLQGLQLTDDASDLTGNTLTGSTTAESHQRKLINSLVALEEARRRNRSQLLSTRGGAESEMVVPTPEQANSIWCRTVGNFPLEVGRTVEQWSADGEDDMTSVSSFLFRRGDNLHIHPPLPPGYKLESSDGYANVLYVKPNQKKTPTCPVDLPSKQDAQTLRIAKIGTTKKSGNVKVAFEPSSARAHPSGLPRSLEHKAINETPKPWTSKLEATVFGSTGDGERGNGENTQSFTDIGHINLKHPSSLPRGNRAEEASLESSMSALLRSCGPRGVVFQKTPMVSHIHSLAKPSPLAWINNPGSDGSEDFGTNVPSGRCVIDKTRASSGLTDSETESYRQLPDAKDLNARGPIRGNNSTNSSPVAKGPRKLVQEQHSLEPTLSATSVPAPGNVSESNRKEEANGATTVNRTGASRHVALAQTPGISTREVKGTFTGMKSASRRFGGLSLATPAGTRNASAASLRQQSKSSQNVQPSPMPYTLSTTTIGTSVNSNSLARSSKRVRGTSLKSYNLGGPAKRSPHILSDGEGSKAKKMDTGDGFEQTPPSPLRQQGESLSNNNVMLNCDGKASVESLDVLKDEHTPLSPVRQQMKHQGTTQEHRMRQAELTPTEMLAASSKLLPQTAFNVPNSANFTHPTHKSSSSINRVSGTKNNVLYETTGTSSHGRAKSPSERVLYETVGISSHGWVKPSSERVFLASRRGTETELEDESLPLQYSSRRMELNHERHSPNIGGQKLINGGGASGSEGTPFATIESGDMKHASAIYEKSSEGKAGFDESEDAGQNWLEDEERNVEIFEHECQIESLGDEGMCATPFCSSPRAGLCFTTDTSSVNNCRASASPRQRPGVESSSSFKKALSLDQNESLRFEVAAEDHSEPPSPESFLLRVTSDPKAPKKRSSEEFIQICKDDSGIDRKCLDSKRNLPIEGEWESPEFSGIREDGGSDEESPLLESSKFVTASKSAQRAGLLAMPGSELAHDSSTKAMPSQRLHNSNSKDLNSDSEYAGRSQEKARPSTGDLEFSGKDRGKDLESLGFKEHARGSPLQHIRTMLVDGGGGADEGSDFSERPRTSDAHKSVEPSSSSVPRERAVTIHGSTPIRRANSSRTGKEEDTTASSLESAEEEVEFPMDDRDSSASDRDSQRYDSDDEDEAMGGGFDQESSLQEESISTSTIEPTVIISRETMNSVRRRIAGDIRVVGRHDSSNENDSICGSTGGAETVCESPVSNQFAVSTRISRNRGFNWRVLHPPHPICILQNLESLNRRRKSKRQVHSKSKVPRTIPRKKRKTKQRY